MTNDRMMQALLVSGFVFFAIATGLVVSTGKPVLIALAMGGLTGLVLLNYLPTAAWLVIGGVMLTVGPIGYFLPALIKLNWLYSVLGFFLMGASLLHMGIGKEHYKTPMPAHVKLAGAFFIYALITIFFHEGNMNEVTGAVKRQFHFFGLLMLFAFVPIRASMIHQLLKFLAIVAVIQLPVSLYQRFMLVPLVEGLEKPGFVALDIVVGTFEGSPTGGGASAVMAMYLVLAGVGLICAVREKLITRRMFWLLFLLVMTPLGLGETKIVLFLIPLALLGAFGDSVGKRPMMFIGGAILTAMVTAVLVYLYFLVQVDGREMTFTERLDETLAYNVGESSYYETGVNRMTAVPYWAESHHLSDPARAIFGYGIGAGFGGDGRSPVRGYVYDAHSGMFIDLVAASSLLWDYGIVGMFLWLAVLFAAWRACSRALKTATSPLDKTLCRILNASLAVSVLMLIYSTSVLLFPTHTMLYWLTLALVAWRVRHGPIDSDQVPPPQEPAQPAMSNYAQQVLREEPVLQTINPVGAERQEPTLTLPSSGWGAAS